MTDGGVNIWINNSTCGMIPFSLHLRPHICLDPPHDPLALLKPAERASYDTRYGAEGDEPHGCMEDTRVQILAEIESWAHDASAPPVYWFYGFLGTGKTTIAHFFSSFY